MKPINFSKYTQLAKGHKDGFEDLPILTTRWADMTPGLISCWELSILELIKVIFSRRIYVQIYDYAHPPILLSISKKEMGVVETERYNKANAEERNRAL